MKPTTLAAIESAAWFGSLSRWRLAAVRGARPELVRKAERRFVQARAHWSEFHRLCPLPNMERIERRAIKAIERAAVAGDQAHFMECASVGCRRCDSIVTNFERMGRAATP